MTNYKINRIEDRVAELERKYAWLRELMDRTIRLGESYERDLGALITRTREIESWLGDLQQSVAKLSAVEDVKPIIIFDEDSDDPCWRCPACGAEWSGVMGDNEVPIYCPYCQHSHCPMCSGMSIEGPDTDGTYECLNCGTFWPVRTEEENEEER